MVRRPLLQHTCLQHAHNLCNILCMGHAGNLGFLDSGRTGTLKGRGLDKVSEELINVRQVATRRDLASAEEAVRHHLIGKHQDSGVTFRDPSSTHVSLDVTIGRDTTIGIGVQLLGKTSIGR